MVKNQGKSIYKCGTPFKGDGKLVKNKKQKDILAYPSDFRSLNSGIPRHTTQAASQTIICRNQCRVFLRVLQNHNSTSEWSDSAKIRMFSVSSRHPLTTSCCSLDIRLRSTEPTNTLLGTYPKFRIVCFACWWIFELPGNGGICICFRLVSWRVVLSHTLLKSFRSHFYMFFLSITVYKFHPHSHPGPIPGCPKNNTPPIILAMWAEIIRFYTPIT